MQTHPKLQFAIIMISIQESALGIIFNFQPSFSLAKKTGMHT
jgi:hypothetical protein